MTNQRGYLMMGLAIALAVSSVGVLVMWKLLDTARFDLAKEKGAYTQFRTGVKDAGKKAEKDKAAALTKQKETHDAVVKDWTTRHYALGVKYAGLRSAGTNTSGSGLPPVPDAARSVDAATRDQRLLDLLQHAEGNTLKLLLLQEWVVANKDSCGRT